jgi:hypothetical protein
MVPRTPHYHLQRKYWDANAGIIRQNHIKSYCQREHTKIVATAVNNTGMILIFPACIAASLVL